MVGTLDVARERLALLVTLLGVAPFLTLAPTASAQSLVALAALTAAAAVAGRCPVVLPCAAPGRLLQSRPRAAAVPLVLAGRTTDVVHHPVRPRAPGLV